MKQRFSDEVITSILDQSSIYTCACPAQVCKAIMDQRILYKYQEGCIDRDDTDRAVHQSIATSVARTHAELESCLEHILLLEGWDMEHYIMPESLQQRMLRVTEEQLNADYH